MIWTASSVTSYLLRASSLVAEQEPRSSVKARLLSIPLTLVFLVVVAVAIGAVVAAALWLVGSLAFSLYVSNFGSYDSTYGSIGGVIVVLLWFYLSAFSIVLGMIVASVLGRRASSSSAYP